MDLTAAERELLSCLPYNGADRSLRRVPAGTVRDSMSNSTDFDAVKERLERAQLIATDRGRDGPVYRQSFGHVGERTLYTPIQEALSFQSVPNGFRKPKNAHIIATALQGRRATGGRWTRPDLTLVGLR